MIETISAYQTTARQFFEQLRRQRVELLLDVRLKNESQLCGFTKKADLAYFTETICEAKYIHDPMLAPDPLLLERYIKHWIDWREYAAQYRQALERHGAREHFQMQYGQYCQVYLLGTATKRRRSHSEVLKAYLKGTVEV